MPKHAPGKFRTTRWSMVRSAGRLDKEADHEALSELCTRYWKPLYIYARGRGFKFDQSEDYVQSFFVWMIEKELLNKADSNRGKFRTFLISSFKNFINNEYDKSMAIKRGGSLEAIHIDGTEGERDFGLISGAVADPEKLFDRAWALSILDITKTRLEAEIEKGGNSKLYALMKDDLLARSQKGAYAQIAVALEMTENAVRVAAHRYRKRYGTLLREEIGRTVEREEQIEQEIKDLLAILGD